MTVTSDATTVQVRTTNPGLFHVSPHTASLGPGQQVTIRIRTSGSGDTVTNQQFQLSFLQTEVRRIGNMSQF